MKQVTRTEIRDMISQIMKEAENQAKFNGEEFEGLTAVEICDRVKERIGSDWEVIDKEGD